MNTYTDSELGERHAVPIIQVENRRIGTMDIPNSLAEMILHGHKNNLSCKLTAHTQGQELNAVSITEATAMPDQNSYKSELDELKRLAAVVCRKHNNGTLSITPNDSLAIDNLRAACLFVDENFIVFNPQRSSPAS